MLKLEPLANKNSGVLVNEVLRKLSYQASDINVILRLIEAADKHESILEDEEIIVDSDNLSKLNKDHIREKYDEKSFASVVRTFELEFPERIKTELARKIYPELLIKLKKDLYIN